MKLRTNLNVIVAALSAVFVLAIAFLEIDSTRRSVREEIEAANVVASQLLKRVAWVYARTGPGPLLAFLEQLGRVRANNITLRSATGEVLYQSPPSPWKAGREAPQWFSRLLMPSSGVHVFALEGGAHLLVEAEASRAILDGWDDLTRLLVVGLIGIAIVNALAFWSVGRALRPFPVIADGLRRIQEGDLAFRLPALRGHEARAIAAAFNRMAEAVEQKVLAERKAREAEARLEERSELARLVEQRLEEERRLIAHELHDEFGQSVTAIRSLALAIANQSSHVKQTDSADSQQMQTSEAARLISGEAARLYDAMHGLIPRLAPLSLDTLGLAATLESLVQDWQRRNTGVRLTLQQNLRSDLGASAALTVYRVVQEGLINALRHARASGITIDVRSGAKQVVVTIADDGVGLSASADSPRPGHFGLRGLKERVAGLGGTLDVGACNPHGVRLTATIPLAASG